MMETATRGAVSDAERIDRRIQELADWRGKLLGRLRKIILEASPELSEGWKWDTPTWSYEGNVCAAGVFREHVKLNFFKGALLKDPKGLFNAGLDAKTTRAIDFCERDPIDESALKELVREAVALNKPKEKVSMPAGPRKRRPTDRS